MGNGIRAKFRYARSFLFQNKLSKWALVLGELQRIHTTVSHCCLLAAAARPGRAESSTVNERDEIFRCPNLPSTSILPPAWDARRMATCYSRECACTLPICISALCPRITGQSVSFLFSPTPTPHTHLFFNQKRKETAPSPDLVVSGNFPSEQPGHDNPTDFDRPRKIKCAATRPDGLENRSRG